MGPRGGVAAEAPAPEDPLERLVRLGLPVRCSAGELPLVAITFNDGPGPFTGAILRTLARRDVPATFFPVASRLRSPALAALAARARRLGAAFGNHTWEHPAMDGRGPGAYREQIDRASALLALATGERPRLFRPPLGRFDDALLEAVRARGMLMVLSTIDVGDGRGATAAQVVRRVRRGLSAGDILLLHDVYRPAAEALPVVLDLVERRGLEPVTVPELLTRDPPTAEQLLAGECP
jgi:peptidoglycan/xylan/chitin deacetylase (PgdA/CDA1 family)